MAPSLDSRAHQEITLTLTVKDRDEKKRRKVESRWSDEGYGSETGMGSSIPITVSEEIRSDSSFGSRGAGERRRFRLPWGREKAVEEKAVGGTDQTRRLDQEKEAEEFILSISGRSLVIQKSMVGKVLKSEKRRVKFGLSSNKVMDLAIRRYSYKFPPLLGSTESDCRLSELERDVQLERTFPKCPEEFGFVLRHLADHLHLPPDSKKFRKLYWDCHGRQLDLTKIMFDETSDMARKRQMVLERIPRKKIHPENANAWWDEDSDGLIVPSRDHVEWICWGYTPDPEEVGRICKRIARVQPPDLETVRLYRAQAILTV